MENTYKTLLNFASDFSFDYNIESDIITWHGDYTKTLGYSSMSSTKEEWLNLIHPDNIDKVYEVLDDLKQSSCFEVEYQIKNSKNEYIWVLHIGCFDVCSKTCSKTKKLSLFSIFIDISVRKKYEINKEKLESTSNLLNDIISTSPLILYIYDLVEDKNIFSSGEIFSIVGYTVDEIKEFGKNLYAELLHPDDIPHVVENNKEIKACKDSRFFEIEFRIKDKDGKYHWFLGKEKVFKRNEEGEAIEKIGSAIEITDIKEANDKTRRDGQLYSKILSSLHEGVVVLDIDFNFLMLNSWIANILNVKESDILGKNIIDCIDILKLEVNSEVFSNYLNRAWSGEIIHLPEQKYEYINKDTNTVDFKYFLISLYPFKLNGTISGVLLIIKNVTIYRQAKLLNEFEDQIKQMVDSQNSIIDVLKKNNKF